MDNQEIRIKIDPNGNLHREVVERSQSEAKKPKLIKRLFPSLSV